MSTNKQPDWKSVERAILIELARQGFEFAEVHYRADYPDNPVFINVRTADQLQPKWTEAVRISNQLKRPEVASDDGLTNAQWSELVSAATNDRAGWVPLGPVEGARHRTLTGPYKRPNHLVDLERLGLITLTTGKSKQTATIRLTEAGKDAIRSMPDKLPGEHLFPLPIDIQRAKANVSREKAAKS